MKEDIKGGENMLSKAEEIYIAELVKCKRQRQAYLMAYPQSEKYKANELANYWLGKVIPFEEWKLITNPNEKDIELYHFVVNGFKKIVSGETYA